MFGSLLRGIFFLIIAGFCAFGTIYFTGLSGSLIFHLNDGELTVSILLALSMLVITFIVLFSNAGSKLGVFLISI